MDQEILNKAEDLIRRHTAHDAPAGAGPYCVLALIDAQGYPTASTVTPAKAAGLREITFCTGLASNKVGRIRECRRAAVCFNGAAHSITLVGDIEIVTDPAVKKEMWYVGLAHHFTGPEDPEYCVLRFRTKRFNLFVDWREVAGTL